MLVSGGGGVVAGRRPCSTSIFCLHSKIGNFSLAISQNWSFSWDLKEKESVSELNTFKRFPPKDLEKVLLKV